MFLYERVLILCKKQETTGDYNFKFEFELDGLKIEDDKSKQNRFSLGFEILQSKSHHPRSVFFLVVFVRLQREILKIKKGSGRCELDSIT